MNKHTKGPWYHTIPEIRIISSQAAVIAQTGYLGRDKEAEREANARLIAAAPDLLYVCEAVKHFMDSDFGSSWNVAEIAQMCDDAIAKAKGKA